MQVAELDLSGLQPIGGVEFPLPPSASPPPCTHPASSDPPAFAAAAAFEPTVVRGTSWVAGLKEPGAAAFGHILYEMLHGGRPLLTNAAPDDPAIPQSMLDVFHLIFPASAGANSGSSGDGCTLQQLLECPIFRDIVLARKHIEGLAAVQD
eukprot:COSAG05_NODE_10459_length_564_cov_1.012903_1_plen_150_part_10